MAVARNKPPNGLGLGVDAAGGPTYDPSANVIELTDRANQRQDDLRKAFQELQKAEVENLKKMMELRSTYESKLSEAESKRLDANRAFDVQASAIDREKQAAAAAVLANQVSISADALRTLVSSTAATIAEQWRIQMAQVTDRLTAVERSQYEGRGKGQGGQDVWKYIAMGVSLLAMTIAGIATIVTMSN